MPTGLCPQIKRNATVVQSGQVIYFKALVTAMVVLLAINMKVVQRLMNTKNSSENY
jgi:hypothetical protein